MSQMLGGLSTIPAFQAAVQMQQVRQFIRGRKGEIEPELKEPASPWNYPMRREVYSMPVGRISVQFSSAWVESAFVPAPANARARVTLDWYGQQYVNEFTDVKAAPDLGNPQNATVLLSGSFKGVRAPISIWLSAHTNFFAAGKSLEDAGSQAGVLLVSGEFGKKDWRILGFAGGGKTSFTEASRTAGAKVEGVIDVEVANIPWEDFHLAQLKNSGPQK
jgi:hypothetical protein